MSHERMGAPQFPNEENQPESLEPKGHPPIEFKDGNLYFPDGTQIVPSQDMRFGPEEYHRDLFIEYERTFGRGEAKTATHRPDTSNSRLQEKYGAGFDTEYKQLAAEYLRLAQQGSADEVAGLMERIKDYRRQHPHLYDDIRDSEKLSNMQWEDIS